ncbi:hypothetical protein GOP47_0001662 [Adiantum capillus-veneris]|uniref:Uncharacterized protein n=1 Tax=Adiantum capillus-veneris TaxID=13818 RepID=A0A9D4V9D3_ADICA|nr:hypothetical protein GOP47_0001662 [Adiantum capillus-veneris]
MELSSALPSQGNEAPAKPVSMRGRKKHKCSVCGNSAKSRCPFHSCKGCCVKAKNPCHIHVLKATPAGDAVQGLPEKPAVHPVASTTATQHHHPNDSLRLRTYKSSGIITRKDVTLINHFRFRKLKEYTEGVNESEDLAFDRYLRNIRLLEVIFGGEEAQEHQGPPSSKGNWMVECASESEKFTNGGVNASSVAAGLQVRLHSNSQRKEAQRQKLKRLIDRGLQRLIKGDQGDGMLDNEDIYSIYSDVRRDMKRIKVQTAEGKERLRKMDLFVSITEKVKQVESQEDFNSCLKTFEDNFVSRTIVNASTPEVLQAPHSQELSQPVVGEDDPPKIPLLNSEKEVLKLGTFNEGRVDSCGVLKSWWQVDLIPGKLDSFVDIPTTMLAAL